MGNINLGKMAEYEKENILKQAPINSNQYNTDLDNQGTRDMTTLRRDNTRDSQNDQERQNSYPMNQQPQNFENENYQNDDSQEGCFGKMKSCYTNPDTPCQNYLMMFLTLVCLIVTIFLMYSVFVKG